MGASTSQPTPNAAENSNDSIPYSELDPWVSPRVITSNSEALADVNSSKIDERSQNDSSTSLEAEEQKQRIVENLSREKEMELFHKELAEKRKQRQEVIAAKANEMMRLKKLVNDLTEKNEILEKENEMLKGNGNFEGVHMSDYEKSKDQNRNLMIQYAETQLSLQNANSDLLLVTEERDELRKHIDSYKDVAKLTKNMLIIRDEELTQLKAKLSEIEESLADRELQWLSNDLKKEYEKQLQDIRNLRTLYDERARIYAQEKIRMSSEMDEYKILLDSQTNKTSDLEQRVEELEKELSQKQSEVRDLESQLGLSNAETRSLQQELTVINQLFSQALLGKSGERDLDMDRLVFLLEQNRDLLSEMAGTESEATSAMPRMLLDLVSQAQENSDRPTNDSISEEGEENKDFQDEDKEEDTIGSLDNDNENYDIEESSLEEELPDDSRLPDPPKMSTAEAIVSRLPKVWRVLMELLNHQSACPVTQDVPEAEQNGGAVPKERGSACYKSVQTPTGPRLVLSVSKTYIRLKDLILEKKSLQKELSRLKQLNSHLETRLGSQERRLGNVSSELSHTWCLAGRMQRSYRTLHSHEQILRYELQQKRKMLNGLKQELQLCREKWQQAREKNTESEVEWKKLRSEFASRKLLDQQDGCGSAESGYSDERSDDSESEARDVTDSVSMKSCDKITKRGLTDQPNEINPFSDNCLENAEISSAHQEDEASCSRLEGVSPWKVLEEGINSAKTILQQESSLTRVSKNSETCNNEQPITVNPNVECSHELVEIVNENTSNSNQLISISGEGTSTENIEESKVESSSTNVSAVLESTNDKSTSINSLLCNTGESSDIQTPVTNDVPQISLEHPIATTSQENSSKYETLESDNTSNVTAQNLILETPDQNIDSISNINPISSLAEQAPSARAAISSTIDTPAPASSRSSATERSPEEILSARDARLRRLEEQCKQLVNKVTRTSHRSVQLCTRLEELHEQYGPESQTNVEQETTTQRDNVSASDGNLEIAEDESQTRQENSSHIVENVIVVEQLTTENVIVNNNNTQSECIENIPITSQEREVTSENPDK